MPEGLEGNTPPEVNEELSTEVPQEVPAELPETKAARIKKFKAAGQELEFNLDDEKSIEELIKLAQLGGGARLSMQEKAEIKKEQEARDKLLKDNPKEYLRKYGYDPEDLAEQILQQKIDEMKKSPEQKQQEELQQKLQDALAKLEAAEKEKETANLTKLEIEAAQSLNGEIIEALESNPILPRSQLTVKRIAEGLSWAIENGFPNAKVKDVIPFVKAEMQREFQQHVESMPEEFIEEFFGQQIMERLRQHRLKKHKEIKNAVPVPPKAEDEKPVAKAKGRMKDFFGHV